MSNQITIELCTEDRARLDRIADRLEAIATQAQFIIEKAFDKPIQTGPDEDIRKALEEAINAGKPDAIKIAQEATEEKTQTSTPPKDETPTEEEPTQTAPARTVSRAELGAKVREMMTKGFKEQTKEIVKSYAPTVPGVPEDKVTECYDRLVALEG